MLLKQKQTLTTRGKTLHEALQLILYMLPFQLHQEALNTALISMLEVSALTVLLGPILHHPLRPTTTVTSSQTIKNMLLQTRIVPKFQLHQQTQS